MQLPYSIKLTMFQFSSTIDHHVARLSILHQLKGSYSSYTHESNGELYAKTTLKTTAKKTKFL